MFDFGDELTIESYRVPWLIWIQLLVLFLLIFLLYCFSLLAPDLSIDNNFTPASSPSRASHIYKPIVNSSHNTQGEENQSVKGEIATSASRRIVCVDNTESDGHNMVYHPCHYFRLAKLAFLKCFGFDVTSENSSSTSDRRSER